MKKIWYTLFIITTISYNLYAQDKEIRNNKFSLSGKIIGRDTGKVYLSYVDKIGKEIRDTALLQQGKFLFTGLIGAPTPANLIAHPAELNFSDVFFLEPNKMTIILKQNHFKNIEITGSKTQEQIEELKIRKNTFKKQALMKAIKELDDTIKNSENSSKVSKHKRDSLWHIVAEEDKKTDYKFIISHPDSYASPFLLAYYLMSRTLSIDSAESAYKSFKPSVQKSFFGKMIFTEIFAQKSTQIGNIAPTFKIKDINQKEIDLLAFRNKSYVLLDFWASWCIPCRAFTPHLKELNRQFRSKGLTIISLSIDRNTKSWKEAVKKDEMDDWINILDTNTTIYNQYTPLSIPCYILIDKNGAIAARFYGDDIKQLDGKLKEILN
jgi:thiol-disulfide isomerase/thioredoxin